MNTRKIEIDDCNIGKNLSSTEQIKASVIIESSIKDDVEVGGESHEQEHVEESSGPEIEEMSNSEESEAMMDTDRPCLDQHE